MQRDAACQLASIFCYEKPAAGWGVVSGEACEFLIEILKAQTEAERFSILDEKFTGPFNLLRRLHLRHGKSGVAHDLLPYTTWRCEAEHKVPPLRFAPVGMTKL